MAYGQSPPMTAASTSAATARSTPTARGTGRLSAEDWAQAALDLIAEQGVSAVAVEPLARRLGVTKGSFYWHFPSREALLVRSEEHTSELQSLMRISYAVFCLKKKNTNNY